LATASFLVLGLESEPGFALLLVRCRMDGVIGHSSFASRISSFARFDDGGRQRNQQRRPFASFDFQAKPNPRSRRRSACDEQGDTRVRGNLISVK
jgi:hypothetical protein